MNADNILFHPHYLGEIMTEPQGKSNYDKWTEACFNVGKYESQYADMKNKETATAQKKKKQIEETRELIKQLDSVKDEFQPSETCKKRLVKIFIESFYGRERDIENKYMKKGLQVEEDAITLYSLNKRTPYFKNTQTLKNEFLEGTPDFGDNRVITLSKTIIDTKASWDLFTFWNARTTALDKMYHWQGQGYCDLIPSANKCVIAYCLIDTPADLIFDELKRLQWKMGVINPETNELYKEAAAKIEKNMVYGDIPRKEKMFEIVVERNDEDIERAHKRIADCREWMNKNLYALLEKREIKEAA